MTRGQISILICLVVFLFLSLGQFFFSIGGTFYDSQRIAQSILLVLSGILFSFSRSIYGQLFFSQSQLLPRVLLLSTLFCVVGFWSALFSQDTSNSVMYVVLYALLFVLLLSIATLFTNNFAKAILCLILLFHSGVVLYSSLFLVFALFQSDVVSPWIIYFGFDNIRFFNQVQIFVLPLLLYLFKVRRISIAAHFFMFANLMLMFVGGGLGVALSWLCICLMIFAFDKRVFNLALVHTVVAFLLAYVVLNDFEMAGGGNTEVIVLSDGSRLPIWLSVLHGLEWRHLFFGIGPGLYVDISGVSTVSHPHNFLLELLYEWGALGLVVALSLVLVTLRHYVINVYRFGSFSIGDAFMLSWAGGLLYSLVSGVLVMPVPQTLLFVAWGVVVGYVSKSPPVEYTSIGLRSFWSSVLRFAVFLLSLLYGFMVIFSLLAMSDLDVSIQGPRFWINGLRYL